MSHKQIHWPTDSTRRTTRVMECREGDGVEDTETVDPKVKGELDRLNQASEDINKLENELDEARSKFSSTRNDSTQHLNALAEKIKPSVIKKARPYYEAKEKARKAQEEALKAARQFQSANGIHRAAKETISLAEEKLRQEAGRVLTSEWQEMFNHATSRLMDAEKEKRRSEEEHQAKSQVFSEAEKHMHVEEKKHKRSIARAKPYFERKAELQTKLELLKVAVEALQDAVTQSKRKYSEALSNLEAISNKVHEKRRGQTVLYLPREPCVGAEDDATDGASPGVSSLRTSFDIPDTPSLEQTSFCLGEEDLVECDEDDESGDTGSDLTDCDVTDTAAECGAMASLRLQENHTTDESLEGKKSRTTEVRPSAIGESSGESSSDSLSNFTTTAYVVRDSSSVCSTQCEAEVHAVQINGIETREVVEGCDQSETSHVSTETKKQTKVDLPVSGNSKTTINILSSQNEINENHSETNQQHSETLVVQSQDSDRDVTLGNEATTRRNFVGRFHVDDKPEQVTCDKYADIVLEEMICKNCDSDTNPESNAQNNETDENKNERPKITEAELFV